MQLARNMANITAIALVLLIASGILMISTAQAQEEAHGGAPGAITGGPLPAGATPSVTLETIPYLSFRPNPVGIGQDILVNLWLQPPLHVSRAHTGYTVTITKPDGTKITVGPMNSFTADTTYWFEYVVDMVGTWKLKFSFAGDYYPAGYYLEGVRYATQVSGSTYLDSAYYKPSSTADLDLVVQQEMVVSWLPSPLPTDYWTRPISPENREWWIIGGNTPFNGAGGGPYWPAKTNIYRSNYKFTPYVEGPTSAHIVWRKAGGMNGIFGGKPLAAAASDAFLDYLGAAFTMGAGGPGVAGNPNIVYMGRAYQSITKVTKTLVNGTYYDMPTSVWQCYDIRTGDVYWEQTGITSPPTAITYAENTPAVPGAIYRVGATAQLAALGSGRLILYDPGSGQVTSNVSIAPMTTGTIYNDPLVLSVQTLGSGANTQYRLINWTMGGGSSNFTARILNNITWPFSALGTCDFEAGIAVSTAGLTSAGTGVNIGTRVMAASLSTGQLLWNVTTSTTEGTQGTYTGSSACADHGKFVIRLNDGLWHCWDLYTGKVDWVSELTSYPWGVFGTYNVQSAYGLLYYEQYDGVHAWDWETGKLVWTFESPCNPYETPYEGQNSWFSGAIIGDGMLYSFNVEHSPTSPISRGWKIFCINATSGKGIWNVTGSMVPGIIADGYLTATNYYDGYLYVFGKGQSDTSVSASPAAIAKGSQVLIQGNVYDMSPATKTSAVFSPTKPEVACVSKDSMATYMEYLYMQHPIDGLDHNVTITGVPVALIAIDSNGNPTNIGSVTSDVSGAFQFAWTPPAEGVYKITAAFAGDESYGSSWAETGVSVGPAPAAIQFPEQVAPIDYTMAIIGAAVAVIIAVALVGVLVLRKK